MSGAPDSPARTVPLAEYAAIGDGRSVVLVSAGGSIDWWCAPTLDGPPLFDRLVDASDGASYTVAPVEPFTVERRYRDDSNVLEHIYATDGGRARVTASLNVDHFGTLPWSELVHRIEPLDGSVTFVIRLRFRRNRRRDRVMRESGPGGTLFLIGGLTLALRCSARIDDLAEDDNGATGTVTLRAGDTATLVLASAVGRPLFLPSLEDADRRIETSAEATRLWAQSLRCSPRYGAEMRRSALALRLLLCGENGAIAAAATTSLPERIGGKRNYDYRYAWVRDAAFTISAFLHVGAVVEATSAFAWLMTTVHRHGDIRTMYTLAGDLVPDECTLTVPGYAGSAPVRTGNRAHRQRQLGIYGDVFATAIAFVDAGNVLDATTRAELARLADACARDWRKRDSGLWELEQLEHYTASKIGCWTALDHALKLAQRGVLDRAHVPLWKRERDRLGRWIDAKCWSKKKQSYTFYAGTERLDAAILLAVRVGFARRDRLALTCAAIARELGTGPHLYRYSGAQKTEGAFIACGFWLVEALALLGEGAAAQARMTQLLAAYSINLGVMNEEFDPAGGAMLGNMPQALSHLSLILAALALDAPDSVGV